MKPGLSRPDIAAKTRRGFILTGFLMLPFLLAALTAWAFGLHYNSSPSLPTGLYMVSRSSNANLVLFCPEGEYGRISATRAYRGLGSCPDGAAPLIKPIASHGGDVIEVNQNGITINGKLLPNTAPRSHDRLGRPLEHFPFGTYRAQDDEVWVISTYNPNSFDSRYFGPVPAAIVSHRLRPLWTSAQYTFP